MRISVNAGGLTTNEKKCELSKAEAIEYATARLEEALGVFDIEPTAAEISMWTEGESRDPVQKVTMLVSFRTIDRPIVQEAHSRNIKRAVDRCIEPITRQVRKAKTKKIYKARRDAASAKRAVEEGAAGL